MNDSQQKWRGEPSTVEICYFLVAMLLANSFIGHFHHGEEHILNRKSVSFFLEYFLAPITDFGINLREDR